MPVNLDRGTIAKPINWVAIFTLTTLSIHWLCWMELLFLATKSSSISGLSLFSYFRMGLMTPLPLIFISLVFIGMLHLISRLRDIPKAVQITLFLCACLPAGICLGVSNLLMLDNFTYTLFGFNSINVNNVYRFVYFSGVIILILRWIYLCAKYSCQFSSHLIRLLAFITLSLSLIAGTIALGLHLSHKKDYVEAKASQISTPQGSRPHILMIGFDAVRCINTSLYTYKAGPSRDTTPFLRQHVDDFSLMALNAFANASNTTSSVTSMLTSKHPLDIKIAKFPNVLMGQDSFESLPRILKKIGYTNYQLGQSKYLDAYNMNMIGAFDEVNGRKLDPIIGFFQNSPILIDYIIEITFFYEVYERIRERLLGIANIESTTNPQLKIVRTRFRKFHDKKRFVDFFDLVDKLSENPTFIHAHFLTTHGEKFYPKNKRYSSGKKQKQDWMIDFYDDSLLDMDDFFKKLFSVLEKKHLLDKVIIVFYSDHGTRHHPSERVPLLFKFPDHEPLKVVTEPVQLLDVAPTILDYLEQPIPNWMQGQSLLKPYITKPFMSIADGTVSFPKNWRFRPIPYCDHLKYIHLVLNGSRCILAVHKPSLLIEPIEGYITAVAEKAPTLDEVRNYFRILITEAKLVLPVSTRSLLYDP